MKLNKALNYYLYVILLTIIIYFLVCIVFSYLFLKPFGALTRLGHWPEVFFSVQETQPLANIKKNDDFNSEVLVLGDSFSNKNIWQSYLKEKKSIKIQSYHFSDVGCLDNWLKKIEKSYSKKNKFIVIQVVEQSFLPLFKTLGTCNQKTKITPLTFKAGKISSKKDEKKLIFDVKYISNSIYNYFKVNDTQEIISSGIVNNVALNNDTLFSNKKSNRMLYLASEDSKFYWKRKKLISTLKKIKAQQEKFENLGIKLIILLIPDKSTQYRKYIKESSLNKKNINLFYELKKMGINTIDLYAEFNNYVEIRKDLYLPNDNHLSFYGYKTLSEIIKKNNLFDQ